MVAEVGAQGWPGFASILLHRTGMNLAIGNLYHTNAFVEFQEFPVELKACWILHSFYGETKSLDNPSLSLESSRFQTSHTTSLPSLACAGQSGAESSSMFIATLDSEFIAVPLPGCTRSFFSGLYGVMIHGILWAVSKSYRSYVWYKYVGYIGLYRWPSYPVAVQWQLLILTLSA